MIDPISKNPVSETPIRSKVTGSYDLDYINDKIKEAEERLRTVERSVMGPINSTLDRADNQLNLINLSTGGAIEKKLSDAEAKLAKIDNKIEKPIVQGLQNVYQLQSHFGYEIPSTEQMLFELETGNVQHPTINYEQATSVNRVPTPTIDLHQQDSISQLQGVSEALRCDLLSYQGTACEKLTQFEQCLSTLEPMLASQLRDSIQYRDLHTQCAIERNRELLQQQTTGDITSTSDVSQTFPPPPPPPPEDCELGFHFPAGQMVRDGWVYSTDRRRWEFYRAGQWQEAGTYQGCVTPPTPSLQPISRNTDEPLKRYTCRRYEDGTMQCVEDDQGEYATKEECEKACKQQAAFCAEECPTLEAFVISQIPKHLIVGTDWGSDDICDVLSKAVPFQFASTSETFTGEHSRVDGAIFHGNAFAVDLFVQSGLEHAKSSAHLGNQLQKIVDDIFDAIPKTPNCDLSLAKKDIIAKIKLSMINKFAFGSLDDAIQGLTYKINYHCPTFIPSTADANSAYVNGTIDKNTWQCWVKANNYHWRPQEKVALASRTRPGWRDWLTMHRLKIVGVDEYMKGMTESGVMNGRDRSYLEDSFLQLPGLSDIMRYMVRDAADDTVARDFNLDKDFDKKYTGRLKDWSFAQGIPDDLAKIHWRAHWEYPSYTQMREMIYLLRPGRNPAGIEFTQEDMRRVLEINDMAPEMVDKLIQITYHPINLSDLWKAYQVFSIDDQQLKDGLMDLSYHPNNADILVNFFRVNRERMRRKLLGLPTASQLQTWYSRGETTERELRDWLEQIKLQPEEIEKTVNSAFLRRNAYLRKGHIAKAKKWFIAGLIDRADAMTALTGVGIDPTDATALINTWAVMIRMREKVKMPTPAMICSARENGIITAEQQMSALVSIGYPQAIALWLSLDCEVKLAKKREKEHGKQKKAAEKNGSQKKEPATP